MADYPDDAWVKDVCKRGQGELCCRYLGIGPGGPECGCGRGQDHQKDCTKGKPPANRTNPLGLGLIGTAPSGPEQLPVVDPDIADMD